MDKPSENTGPNGNRVISGDDTAEGPAECVSEDKSCDRCETKQQEIVILKKQLSAERRKNKKGIEAVQDTRDKLDVCKGKLESSDATRAAVIKKYKSEIAALRITQKAALQASITSSKQIDAASKQSLATKSDTIRGLRKDILDKARVLKDGAALQSKVSKLNDDFTSLTKEKNDWIRLKTVLNKTIKTLEAKVNDQADAKYAHQLNMAEVSLKARQVSLEMSIQRAANSQMKNSDDLAQKMKYQAWNYGQKEIQKDNETKRKEATRDSKAKKVAARLQIVSSGMLRTNIINGGAFPSPALGMREVSLLSRAS
jgi:hypothetical protein